jgi:catechol 2,3-dioxygenase-like lactoylglutathione lyase family enzyme
MIDHIGITVGDFERARRFYDAALSPIGVAALMEVKPEESGGYHGVGYGKGGKPFFWLSNDQRPDMDAPVRGTGLHIAFAADDRSAVDAFFVAATAAGGRDNGPPGVRPHYHPSYYAAFVIDPDGVNVEVVCHIPV